MAAPPLTHHDILALAEPFTRGGRSLDLAASDRTARRLVFRPLEHGADAGGTPALHENLQLEARAGGSFRLTRTLTPASAAPGGPQATLQVVGRQPAALLALIDGFPHDRQFRAGPGFVLARSYDIDAADGAGTQPVLTRGTLQTSGLTMTMTVPAMRRLSADISLTAGSAGSLPLPDDLLAVLGWNWARLLREKSGWKSKLRLRGSPQQRSRHAEGFLELAAHHLALTLASPPCRFHDRLRAARWGVFFRRAIPALNAVALLAALAFLPRFEFTGFPGLWVLLYHVPTALIALSFCLQELPAFEIPPWPRRATQSDWQTPAAAEHLSRPPA